MQQFIRTTFLLLMTTAACFAQQPLYKTVANTLQDAETLKGTKVYVYGIVKEVKKDGFSKTSFIVELEGDIRVRLPMTMPAKTVGSGGIRGSLSYSTSTGNSKRIGDTDLPASCTQWEPDTKVVVVGILKKESGWVIDKATIKPYSQYSHPLAN